MNLLRPYPDELVGSALDRSTRQLGVRAKRLLSGLTGRNIGSHSKVLTCHPAIAEAFGMSPCEFLAKHTLFPYATAFMKPDVRTELEAQITADGPQPARTGSISASATRGVQCLRFCRCCVRQDLQRFGEAYWRRAHHLPGMTHCLEHGCALMATDISVRHSGCVVSPDRCAACTPLCTKLPEAVHEQIAKMSVAALNGDLSGCMDWGQAHKCRATELGYAFTGGQVFVKTLAQDLLNFYGDDYLKDFRACFKPEQQTCWPARMVRPASPSLPPLLHVLFEVFLETSPCPSCDPVQVQRRSKLLGRDWSQADRQALQRVKSSLDREAAAGRQATVTSLMKASRNLHMWKCHREQLPGLASWVEGFLASPQNRAARRVH
jgi:hypothetical protein